MNPFPTHVRELVLCSAIAALVAAGCVSVGTPREISVNTDVGGRPPVDASSVPPTRDHEEARQKLAEAYAEIRSLRSRVDRLERDKKELKRERDGYKDERDECREAMDEAQEHRKKQREDDD
jgi:outer membrane murein-binding lipoprotein Lpp